MTQRVDPKRLLLLLAAAGLTACGDKAPAGAAGQASAAAESVSPARRETPALNGDQAAEVRDARSLYILGARYADGVGVAKNAARARALWQQAAEQGDADAQTGLGLLLTLGEGGPRDPVGALAWYRRAAVQGHAAGQLYLGLKLRDGEGGERDRVMAYAWLSLAAAGTGPASVRQMATAHREALAAELSDAERAAAQALAAAWRPGQLLAR